MDISTVIKPFINLFSTAQIQSIFLAWLPTKLEPFLTGIMAVDMFVTTVIAFGISTLCHITVIFFRYILIGNSFKDQLTVQIEYYIIGRYNERIINVIYESLSWLISQQTKNSAIGSFVVKVIPNLNSNKTNEEVPKYNVLPENNQKVIINYKGHKFNVQYKIPKNENDNNTKVNNNESVSIIPEKPSIYLSTLKNSIFNISDIYDLLDNITQVYLESLKKSVNRNRYENQSNHWCRVQTLPPCRGLESIALSEENEELLKKELKLFVSDKKFYEKIGVPYKRGILLYGKPGTGKTSLINAISSHLSRDIYYLNLKMVKEDSDLSALFSAVPSNQMIVLEDIDTQSTIIHRRTSKFKTNRYNNIRFDDAKQSNQLKFGIFSLTTFLSCLDGHRISEGNIIIMTTNHKEFLDTACIRKGRMDVHLELGYCTHYQIRKLFECITNNTDISDYHINKIPEKLLPPCEVMAIMTLYRDNKLNCIMEKIIELVNKYQNNYDDESNLCIEEIPNKENCFKI